MTTTRAAVASTLALTGLGSVCNVGCGGSTADGGASSSSTHSGSGGGMSSSGTTESAAGSTASTSTASLSSASTTTASSATKAGSSASSSGSTSDAGDGGGGGLGETTSAITIYQCVDSPAYCGASGELAINALFEYQEPCVTTTSGACSLTTCAMVVTNGGLDAGTLTVSGGSIPAGTVVGNGGPGLYNTNLTGVLLSSGQTVSMSATGAAIPAFGPEAVKVPPLVTVASPSFANAGTTTISRASDLTVEWTGGAAGQQMTMLISLFASGGDTPYDLQCSWNASLGHGTAPAALLQMTPAGIGGTIQLGQQSTTTFTAGAHTLTESAMLYRAWGVSIP